MKRLVCVLLSLIMLFMCGCTVDDVKEFIQEQESALSYETVGDILSDFEFEMPEIEVSITTTPSNVTELEPAEIDTSDETLYYNNLNERQKQMYCYMKTAAEQMHVGYFKIGSPRDDVQKISDIVISYRALLSDNPQFFYLPSTYMMSSDSSSMAFSLLEENVGYLVTESEKISMQNRLDRVVNDLVSQAERLDTDYEKELFFHDWLCQNVTYTQSDNELVYTTYGALVNGKAVCEGYSRAMQMLCKAVNIPCTVIYGSSRGEGHMWNVINPGDGWYHLDVTWDDSDRAEETRHSYFNVTDTDIAQDHEISYVVNELSICEGTDSFNFYLYECNNTKNNYFVKSGLIFTADSMSNAKIIINADQKGQDSIEVYYSGDDYEDVLYAVNEQLWRLNSDTEIERYSYSGNSLMLWW